MVGSDGFIWLSDWRIRKFIFCNIYIFIYQLVSLFLLLYCTTTIISSFIIVAPELGISLIFFLFFKKRVFLIVFWSFFFFDIFIWEVLLEVNLFGLLLTIVLLNRISHYLLLFFFKMEFFVALRTPSLLYLTFCPNDNVNFGRFTIKTRFYWQLINSILYWLLCYVSAFIDNFLQNSIIACNTNSNMIVKLYDVFLFSVIIVLF